MSVPRASIPIVLTVVSSLVAWSPPPRSAESRFPEGAQESTQESASPAPLDRLHHPSGTTTGRAGIARVERRGTGPVPLVLIAGAPFGAPAWDAFLARNESHYRMLAVTPAGYEGTPPPAMPDAEHEDYAERAWTEALMDDLVALMEKELIGEGKPGPAFVVGHHLMGDYYAVRLACEHPELVRGVVSLAGMGTFPIGQGAANVDAEARARFVRDSRAPFFRGVSQETWNANTFHAGTLSKDAERGGALYRAQVAVPIETQVRYYLEYMTDELESRMEFVQAPVLALTLPSTLGFDSLSQAMKDQLVQRFGSLEKARSAVHFGSPWEVLAARAEPGRVRLKELPDAGIFAMDDSPEAFDRALAEFVAGPKAPASPTAGKTGDG